MWQLLSSISAGAVAAGTAFCSAASLGCIGRYHLKSITKRSRHYSEQTFKMLSLSFPFCEMKELDRSGSKGIWGKATEVLEYEPQKRLG